MNKLSEVAIWGERESCKTREHINYLSPSTPSPSPAWAKEEENSSQTVGEFQSSQVSSIFCKWVVVLKKKKKKKMFVFKCLCSKHRLMESQQIPICFLFASEKLSWNQFDLSRLLNSLVPIHTIIAPKRIPFSPQCLLSKSQFEFLYYLNLNFLSDFMIISLMAFS